MTPKKPSLFIEAHEISTLNPDLILDCRAASDRSHGAILDSKAIDPTKITAFLKVKGSLKTDILLVFCDSGVRSVDIVNTIRQEGYPNTYSLTGGFNAWAAKIGSADQRKNERFRSQINVHSFGKSGQEKLAAGRILVVGAGGIGSPVLQYLGASGFGAIIIADGDLVELSNLPRQTLYTEKEIGQSKANQAQIRISEMNSASQISNFSERITAKNIDRLAAGCDLIIDAVDNFETRYLLALAAHKHQIPIIHGSVHGWDGQVSLFKSQIGPCFFCAFPIPPPASWNQSCSEEGVIGAAIGIVGSMIAAEAIKVITGQTAAAESKIIQVSGMTLQTQAFDIEKVPACPCCSTEPILADYSFIPKPSQQC